MPQTPQVVDLCVALAGSSRSVSTQPVRRHWRSHSLILISIDVPLYSVQPEHSITVAAVGRPATALFSVVCPSHLLVAFKLPRML